MNIFYGIGIAIWLAVCMATIAGLIRPSLFTKLLKRFAKRRYIFTFGLILFFLIPLAISPIGPASLRNASVTPASQPGPAQVKTAASTIKPASESAISKETKQVSITQIIPFARTTQDDNSLSSGQTKTSQIGVNGEETIVYNVTYVAGKETARVEQSTAVTNQPVTQITDVGTYVAPTPTVTPQSTDTTTVNNCTNGTYINSAGNTVCSPEASTTVPSGATAQCKDSTYSFSQSRSGTCSHHGGVLTWL